MFRTGIECRTEYSSERFVCQQGNILNLLNRIRVNRNAAVCGNESRLRNRFTFADFELARSDRNGEILAFAIETERNRVLRVIIDVSLNLHPGENFFAVDAQQNIADFDACFLSRHVADQRADFDRMGRPNSDLPEPIASVKKRMKGLFEKLSVSFNDDLSDRPVFFVATRSGCEVLGNIDELFDLVAIDADDSVACLQTG